MTDPRVRIFADNEALSRYAALRLTKLIQAAVAEQGRCTLVLSGGSTPQRLYELLAEAPYSGEIPWAQLDLFWGDERCVPADDAASNYGQVQRTLLAHVPIPAANIYAIDGSLPAAVAADDYARRLAAYAQATRPDAAPRWPHFDIVLMGMGADGHIASIFPHSPICADVPTRAVEASYGDRPAQRVTLTEPVFNDARLILFLVTGANKADVMRRVLLETGEPLLYPAQRLHPHAGSMQFLVDQDAAALIE